MEDFIKGMKEYTSSSPEFSDSIKILDVDTPNHAEGVNVATRQILDNTVALKDELGKIDGSFSDLKEVAFSGSYKDLEDKPSAEDIGAVAKTGDTMTGNLTVDSSGGEAQVNVQRGNRSGRLVVSTSDNLGLYDATHGKWVVKSDSNGNVTLNGSAASASSATNASNAANADKVDDFHAASFLGNGTGYVCPPATRTDLNSFSTEYHGFTYNCPNAPTGYGFLDVTYFDGALFAPYGTGAVPVVRQVFTKWDTGEMWSRTCVNGSWASWVFLANNNYTGLSGRFYLRTVTVSIGSGTSVSSGFYGSGGSATVGSFSELAVLSLSGGSSVWLTSWSYSGTTLTVSVLKSGSSATSVTVHYITR